MDVESASAAKLIGELFIERGLVTPEQLHAALEEQRTSGERLGEILISNGLISRLDLADALGQQWHSPPAQVRPSQARHVPHLRLVQQQRDEHVEPEPLDLDEWLHYLQAELDKLGEQPTPEVTSFLVAPTPGGYRLLEWQGVPPTVGDHLHLPLPDCDDATFVVVRLGGAPLPRDIRRYAYLERAPLQRPEANVADA